MNLNTKDIFVSAGIIIGAIYLFSMGPDFKSLTHLHEVERKEQLEDRSYMNEKRGAALKGMMSCYQEARDNYNVNWGRACRSQNDQKIRECIASNISEATCNTKFVFNRDCELPGVKADYVSAVEDKAKQECLDIFHILTNPIEVSK